MSRAVLVSSSGDPFLDHLGFNLFKKYWYDEVDRYWININNHNEIPSDVIAESIGRLITDPKVNIIYHPTGLGNGVPVTELIKVADEEYVMLLENDGFIFTKGVVDRCFNLIERGDTDIVGSPRRSCGTEIWDQSKEKYNLDYSGYGDVGPNWWPNFWFLKRSDLLKTDMNFGSIEFKPGQYCKELDYTFKETNYGDTSVWMSMQLRALGLRSVNVPQHHAGVYEAEDKVKGEQNWHPTQQPFEWIHAGSLSSGWGGYLNRLLPDVSTDSNKQEIETRVAFWQISMDETAGFDKFKVEYAGGINQLIVNANLDTSRIDKKIEIYRQLMKL